jgi:ubiquinone/menaquinone biosynthesis C-methylase UbiE
MKTTRIERWFMNRPHHAQRVISRADRLLSFVDMSGNQNFLEVGCGSGAVSKHIAKKYLLKVAGVDVDPDQIQRAQESVDDIAGIHFLAADSTKLPFRDNLFGVVLSFGVMHHISNWLDALGEIRRVLKPKGYFVYYDLIYREGVARFGRSLTDRCGMKSYGITTMHDLSSFIGKSSFSTIYALQKSSLLWYELEAVYQSD